MQALYLIGGLIVGAVFVTCLAAYHAKRAIPATETRNEIEAVAQSRLWWPILLAPLVSAALIIAGKSGWL